MFTSTTIIALSALAATVFAAPAPTVTTQTLTATHGFGAGPTAFSWTTTITLTPDGAAQPTTIDAPVEPTPIVLPEPTTRPFTVETITATADFGAGPVPFTWTTTIPVAAATQA